MDVNRLVNDNIINDDYIIPCNFNTLRDEQSCDENHLGRAQLDLNNLQPVTRENGFNFDESFNQDGSQICSEGRDIDDGLFSNSRDILNQVYRNYDSDSNPHLASCQNELNSSTICTCLNDNSNGQNIVNSSNSLYCTNSTDHSIYSDTLDECTSHNNTEPNVSNSLSLVPNESKIMNINSSECNIYSDCNVSITKTLRGIKRVPPPVQNNISLSSDMISYTSDPTYKPTYEVLSCTVLIDASSKTGIDFNLANTGDGCPISDEILEDNLTSHNNISLINSDKVYHCSDCDKLFREKSHLVSHSRAHRDVRKFKCDKCEMSFKTESNLHFHLSSHSEDPLKCPHCGKQFTVRRVLTRHIRVVHSQENFECEQCGKKFKTRKNLINHYGVHSGIRPFACHICTKTFLHSSSLNMHLREHDQNDCTQCSSPVDPDTQTEIRNSVGCTCGSTCSGNCHKDTRTCQHSFKPFLCSTCGKPFKLKSSLVSHMKTHTPNKQYKCDDCDKLFLKRLSYEIHMKRHRGERPEYMCDQCCQSYYSQFSLRRHYLKHTTKPGFTCNVCLKNFWNKDALQVHSRSHTKEKYFKCPICDKNFSHKSSLVTHTRSLHPQSKQILQPVRSSAETVSR